MRRAPGWLWKPGVLSTFVTGLFAVLPIVITVDIMAWFGGWHIEVYPNVAKNICRTGLQARLFKCEIVLDLVSADLTKCEIFKQPQKDIYAL